MNTSMTVGELVARRPELARTFERLGIDYCCGGRKTLAEACQARGLDAASIAAVLEAAEGTSAESDKRDWTTAGLRELCEHIVSTHHAFLGRELPRIAELVAKVHAVHRDVHPELEDIRYTFVTLRAELEEHMLKEERILFPAIASMEEGGEAGHCGIERPIAVMEHEHDSAGQALARLRELTGGYVVPADGCNTYRVVMQAMAELEKDLHLHIHKENNILFPRAMELAGRSACHA